MKTRYQHVNLMVADYDSPHPRLTFCYIEDENRPGKTYAGVSICTAIDNPCKETGRTISRERAQAAYDSGESSGQIIIQEALDILDAASAYIPMVPTHKSLVINHEKFRFGFV